jgi:dolichol-phosphate mannosyltransferase
MNDSAQRMIVVIPTFNEAENLAAIIGRVRTSVPDSHVLVVDDGSPDGTGQVAESLAADDDRVRVLHRPERQGLGAAYVAGFRWCLDRGFELIGQMDADGSHQPEQLPQILRGLDGADAVLGSRWVPGGEVLNWPWTRKVLSRGGNIYVRVAMGAPVRDATGGYRIFRRHALEAIDLNGVASRGYCFQVDVVQRLLDAGLRVTESPITFVEREHGTSKMSRNIVIEALWRVTAWGFERRIRRRMRPQGRSD